MFACSVRLVLLWQDMCEVLTIGYRYVSEGAVIQSLERSCSHRIEQFLESEFCIGGAHYLLLTSPRLPRLSELFHELPSQVTAVSCRKPLEVSAQ